MNNIFISYSTKSRAVVDALAIDLEAMGYTVWFDRQLTGGQDWWAEILNSIRRCQLFLFALTPESMESYPCKLEYDYAYALNKRILPVMLADINIKLLPSSLQKFQLVDYRQQNKQQVLALTKALNNLPPAKALPKPLPPKPDMPLPLFTRLRDQIDAHTLKSDEQKLILAKLKELLNNPDSAADAAMLLRRMRDRHDLLVKVDKEIGRLLAAAPSPTPPKRTNSNATPCTLKGHSEAVFSVAYAPDGSTALTGSVDKTARLWDVATGKELRQFVGHGGSIWSVAYAPNGRTILTGSRDKTARLWDAQSGKELRCFDGHTDSVWGVAYSPDGHTVLTGSFDKTVRLWDVASGRELKQLNGHKAAVWGVTFSPNGQTILTGSWDKTVRIWDAVSGTELRLFATLTDPVSNVVFSPDGTRLLINGRDTMARLWDVKTGKEVCQFSEHVAFSAAYAPDGRTILTGSPDKTARLWDVRTGKTLREFSGHADAVTCVTYSPDGRVILTGSVDGTARLWDFNGGKSPC
jgi:hypothetical protein